MPNVPNDEAPARLRPCADSGAGGGADGGGSLPAQRRSRRGTTVPVFPAELSFDDYVAMRYTHLLRVAQALTADPLDAEDLLQTSLAKTYLAWDRIRDKQAADAYVRRTLVNTQCSWWRRRRLSEIATDTVPEPVVADRAPDVELRQLVTEALGLLPRRQRTMIMLRFGADLSEAETARRLGVAVGTVKSSVSRGLARLRSELAAHEHVLEALGVPAAEGADAAASGALDGLPLAVPA